MERLRELATSSMTESVKPSPGLSSLAPEKDGSTLFPRVDKAPYSARQEGRN